MSKLVLVYSWVKLSGKSVFSPSNLGPVIFFGALILGGYSSVVLTVYELVKGVPFVGSRPDILNPN